MSYLRQERREHRLDYTNKCCKVIRTKILGIIFRGRTITITNDRDTMMVDILKIRYTKKNQVKIVDFLIRIKCTKPYISLVLVLY